MSVERVREWFLQAAAVTVLTGAGISAESGIPTFRGAAGLWKQFRPEDLATPEAFDRNPELVWEWYDWRRELIGKAQPNPGHLALANLERQVPHFTLVTQNVDGLHQRAGSRNVLEVHGSIWTLRCTRCRREWADTRSRLTIPPRCGCGALARPGVVWFGEMLPADVWSAAETATTKCEFFLVVGTSAQVYPAAGLITLAAESGAKVVEINTETAAASSDVACRLTGLAGQILPTLVAPKIDANCF